MLQPGTTIQELLVKKASNGDSMAREELFRGQVKTMYHHAVRITGNQKDAEDIVQQSFIVAFASLKLLKEPGAFGGWLRQIVVRKALRFCKRKMHWDELTE